MQNKLEVKKVEYISWLLEIFEKEPILLEILEKNPMLLQTSEDENLPQGLSVRNDNVDKQITQMKKFCIQNLYKNPNEKAWLSETFCELKTKPIVELKYKSNLRNKILNNFDLYSSIIHGICTTDAPQKPGSCRFFPHIEEKTAGFYRDWQEKMWFDEVIEEYRTALAPKYVQQVG